MRLISWNTAHKTKKCEDQAKAILARRPDILALQEITTKTKCEWREHLKNSDLKHVVDSFQLAEDTTKLSGPRQYGELIASRWPLLRSRLNGTTWPERALSTFIKAPSGNVELLTTGVPPGVSNGWIKINVLGGVFSALAHTCRHPRILCGDFNTPKKELDDGRIVTWAQYINKRDEVVTRRKFRGRDGQEWDRGERNVLEKLESFGLEEVFRSLHGHRIRDFSWFTKNATGRRFDHIFASPELRPVECSYLHELREKKGLSDHSPIEADFKLD